MNKGGEPERDDYGLPPVDIDVPDDARELDADVQAYHRELRALRRQARSRRWRLTGSGGVLQRTGLVMPLVAGCLVLAMLSGMVLTMFTANAYLNGAGLGNARFGAPFRVQLPDKQIDVHGQPPVIVSHLRVAALAVIPRNCGCDLLVQTLIKQAGTAGVAVYLVGSRASQGYISRLASGSQAGPVYPATDVGDVLVSRYPTVLTVLLVDSKGDATAVQGLQPGFRLQRQLARLASRPPAR